MPVGAGMRSRNSNNDGAAYLERAAELRAIADQTASAEARASLRKLAAAYERMARRTETDQ